MLDWKRGFTVYKGLPTSIYVIFISRIVNSLGNFVFPFLTLFLTQKLGMGEAQTGFFVMVAGTVALPGLMLGGKLADHLGRKRVYLVSNLVSALALIPCAYLGNSLLIPWLLILSSFCGGLARPASGAMVSDLTVSTNRKSAYSLLYLGMNIGFAVGPMLAGFLFYHYVTWLFLGDAFTTLLAIFLVAYFVPETRGRSMSDLELAAALPVNEQAETGGLFQALLKRPLLLLTSFLLMIFSFVYAQQVFALPLQLNGLFGAHGPSLYGILMSINAVTVVILTPAILALTVRLKSTVSMGFGGVFYALGFGMICFIHSVLLFVISTIAWTIGEILVTTNSGVLIANNSPISHRARFNATLNMISRAGGSISPWLTGIIVEHITLNRMWLISFSLAFMASLVMFNLQKENLFKNKALEPGV